ncbi:MULTISPECIES: protein kinase [unclassified Streptomyces]|uniref:protein kinase domain-containing protein n=2 Tax=Streptomyces TaxID=1883 RepID=UPI001F1C0472|nr:MULTISPECIES: protein kinase [unclassified Streptomyces]
MGVVYLARSPRGRMVAVKSIRLELAALPDFRLRFAEEVAIAQRVGGDWTAAVLDADPHAERPWVATAYVPGPTLAEVVARHGPLPERSVRGLASGLCDALADIHAAGLVHRDLKPSNVMITIDGPKVIDFGIVRALDGPTHGGLTSTGVVVGSPGFMAPEQVRGERLTAACDIFSLGSVLAFAAAGRLPFDTAEGRPHALMYRVVHEEPDLTGIPEALLPLIGDCLAKDPEARPSLATLRTREETQFRHLGPWLPAPVLARLGQDAAQLLEHEDPGTVLTAEDGPPPAQPPEDEIGTVPAQRPAVPATAPVTAQAEPEPRPGTPTTARTLAEERNGRNGPAPSTVAVYATLALFGLAALGTTITQLNLLSGTVSDASSLDEGVAYPWGYIQTGAAVGFIVSWLIWCAKTRAIAEEFAPGRLRYEPRLAVLSWFIPLGNLYLPKQIANDVWHASSPTSLGGAMAPATRLHVWWGCAVFTIVTSPLYLYWSAFAWAEHGEFTSYNNGLPYGEDGYKDWATYDMSEGTMVGLILRILVLPTVVATALYVSRLTAMQQARRTS